MITIKVTLHGAEDALAEFDRRQALARTNVEKALGNWGKLVTDEMIETHTFQNRTFRLEGSIGYDVHPFSGTEAALGVHALAPYASQVEFGHPGPPPARPYPFFWPVFWNREPDLWFQLEHAWLFGWSGLPWYSSGSGTAV